MKRSLENPDNDQQPSSKKQHLCTRNVGFLKDSKGCDVTFCIPLETEINIKDDDHEAEDIDVKTDEINNKSSLEPPEYKEYKKYKCIKAFFAQHSKYFETILFDNGNITIDDEIKLDDINCETFEFIKYWCYDINVTKLNKNNILHLLVASHKYCINELYKSRFG